MLPVRCARLLKPLSVATCCRGRFVSTSNRSACAILSDSRYWCGGIPKIALNAGMNLVRDIPARSIISATDIFRAKLALRCSSTRLATDVPRPPPDVRSALVGGATEFKMPQL